MFIESDMPPLSVVAVGDVNDVTVSGIEEALAANLPRIMRELNVIDTPLFVVKVWSDPAEFKAVFESEGGRGGVTRGYVNTEQMEIRLLDGADVEEVAVHEVVHIVMLAVNPTIAANPFWLWEAVALYVDGSGPPDTELLSCISSEGGPSLTELNEYPGNSIIFRMGYLLADYVIENWGQMALRSLIESNGDIETVLGIGQEQFERDWLEYVLATYEFQRTAGSMTESELVDRFSGNTLANKQVDQSTFLAADGNFYYGRQGFVQAKGRWYASDSDEICLEFGSGKPRCSRWYENGSSTYRLASRSDCVFQDWELILGDARGLTTAQ
ncbi:MAG: hypothetical protein ACR2Q3_16865 [Woeseiaceae bacterium]